MLVNLFLIITISVHCAHTNDQVLTGQVNLPSNYYFDNGELMNDFLIFVDDKSSNKIIPYALDDGSGSTTITLSTLKPTARSTTKSPSQNLRPFISFPFRNTFPGLTNFDLTNKSVIYGLENCLTLFYRKYYTDVRNVRVIQPVLMISLLYASASELVSYTIDFDLPDDESLSTLKDSLNDLRTSLDVNSPAISDFEKISYETFEKPISIDSGSLIMSLQQIDKLFDDNYDFCESIECTSSPFINKVCAGNVTKCLHVCDKSNQAAYCKNNGVCQFDQTSLHPNCTCTTNELSSWGLNTNYIGVKCESKRTTFGQDLFILIVTLSFVFILAIVVAFLVVTHITRKRHKVEIITDQHETNKAQFEPTNLFYTENSDYRHVRPPEGFRDPDSDDYSILNRGLSIPRPQMRHDLELSKIVLEYGEPSTIRI